MAELAGTITGDSYIQGWTQSRVAHLSGDVISRITGNESRVAHMSADLLTALPTGDSRIAHFVVELVSSRPRSELSAHTVPYSEQQLVGST